MEIEETIANSSGNQDQLILALQEKLRDFGLTKNESKIYVFLSKKGPKKAIEISREEKIPRTETYHLLSTLETKGIITASIQRPTRFFAVTIEKAIESIIHNQQKKIEELKILKHDMVELWNLSQTMKYKTKSDISKFETAMKKYAKSSRLRSIKRNERELRRKSDMLDN
jgi:sugar-specific transcriptional regulator TrmB